MIKTFKVLSALLSYPSAELQAAAGAGDGDGAGDGAGEIRAALLAKEAREILSQPSRIISALKQRLEKGDGGAAGYAAVLAAIESIADGRSARQVVDEILTGPGDAPGDLDTLDRDWQEQPVLFGPGNAAAMRPADPGQVYVNPPARN